MKIKWELVENTWLCFDSGDFSATVNLTPTEDHYDDFLYTVMCGANVLEEKFAGTLQKAIVRANEVLTEALTEVKK